MIARRIYWATMPYWGWVPHTKEDELCGAVPPPWYAYPLAWVHRICWWWLNVTKRDTFGPHFRTQTYRVGDPIVKEPWR